MPDNSHTRTVVLPSAAPCADMGGRRVFVLMACYNGARHVEEQIRSIQAQNFSAWTLVARDDGSRDDTVKIIQRLAREDARIHLWEDDARNLGAPGNFSALMRHALEQGADYAFLADQDDIWHPDKLGLMLGGMRALEAVGGGALPLLVHCDLAVVDDEKKMIAPSFTQYMRLSPASADLGDFLLQNQASGCASLVNRVALDLACPVPSGALMHDWWLALLCVAGGRIGWIVQSLVQYRQHGANTIGAQSNWRRVAKFLYSPQRWRAQGGTIRDAIGQAGLVRQRLSSAGKGARPGAERQLDAYASLLAMPAWKRVAVLKANGIPIYKKASRTGLVFLLLLALQHREKK